MLQKSGRGEAGGWTRRELVGAAALAGASAIAGCGGADGGEEAPTVTNVKDSDFGAAGDGSTDDTDAIRDAVDAAGSTGTVFFPPGEYLVSSHVDLGGASVDGAGRHEVTVRAESDGDWDLDITSEGGDTSILWAENEDEWTAQNIGIDSNDEDASCITNYGGSWVALTDLHARNSDDSGIQHWGGAGEDTGDCHHCLTANNSVRNCRWNLVFDGSVFNSNMIGNVSFEGGARHVSVDNRTHTDMDMRGVSIANNTLEGHGDQASARHAIYFRGGSEDDVQRSTDGTVYGQVTDNVIRGWPGVGVEIRRAIGSVAGNSLHSDDSHEFTDCFAIDSHGPGLTVQGNLVHVGSRTDVLDHSAATPGANLWILDNKDATGDARFYASDATDPAWVFEDNFSGTTEVMPG